MPDEDLEEEGDEDDGAEVPFLAKRAAHVRSAWGMKVLLPVSARWYTVAARSALLDASSKLLLLGPSAWQPAY